MKLRNVGLHDANNLFFLFKIGRNEENLNLGPARLQRLRVEASEKPPERNSPALAPPPNWAVQQEVIQVYARDDSSSCKRGFKKSGKGGRRILTGAGFSPCRKRGFYGATHPDRTSGCLVS